MKTEPDFVLQIQYNFTDTIRADRLYRASMTSMYQVDRMIGKICIALGIVNLLLIGFLTLKDFYLSGDISIKHISAGPLLYFAAGMTLYFDIISSVAQWIRFQKNKVEYTKPFDALFTNNQIVLRGEQYEVQYKWAFFKNGLESQDLFILVYGKNAYFSIPKRVFQYSNDINVFRSVVSSKLSTYKQIS